MTVIRVIVGTYIGGSSSSLHRRIFSRIIMASSNVVRDVIEYTTKKACPSRIHWSCIDENSSCPAVSRMSNKHAFSSITTDLRYESSIVG